MRKMMLALAVLALMPASAADGPGALIGTWVGKGQPGDDNLVWSDRYDADGWFTLHARKCQGTKAMDSVETGRWREVDGLVEVVTLTVDGHAVHYVDRYSETVADGTRSSRLVGSDYPNDVIGFVFVSHKVADDYTLPACTGPAS